MVKLSLSQRKMLRCINAGEAPDCYCRGRSQFGGSHQVLRSLIKLGLAEYGGDRGVRIARMPLMSFALTTSQLLEETKTVTRRLGWSNLKPGDLFCGVRKCMGFKPGEKVERLAILRCEAAHPSILNGELMTEAEVAAEGFPGLSPAEFVAMFCDAMGCAPDAVVNRIRFSYIARLV